MEFFQRHSQRVAKYPQLITRYFKHYAAIRLFKRVHCSPQSNPRK
ncbi:hypothetical protein AERO9AM_20255 [Aeromicrobium sp. 9AM]|nr:hypothetical protein AERO9AM_20255 [Aeromicrobium sp. 9AM]